MFKKPLGSERVPSHPLKSSATRQLRASLSSEMPPLTPHLDSLIPKKSSLYSTKLLNISNASPDDNDSAEPMADLNILLYALNPQDHAYMFFLYEKRLFPHLRILHQYPDSLPIVQVDKGAIKFVLNGADIMCPGLTSKGGKLDVDLPKHSPVAVYAEGMEHALAIGYTLMSTDEMFVFLSTDKIDSFNTDTHRCMTDRKKKNKGMGIKNLHFLNDGLWKAWKDSS